MQTTTGMQDGLLRLESLFIDSDSLPSPPATVLEVIRRADDPEVEIEDLAELIELDVALSIQLIRMSNSSLYSPVNEITSIERAIATLGLRSVRLLALTTSLRMLLPDSASTFDMSEIRQRMVVNGSLSRAAAGEVARRFADEAFTCGLLSGLGRVVLAIKAPEVCAQAVEMFGCWPTLDGERSFFGFSSDEVTTNLIQSWGLPYSLSDAISRRSQPPVEDESNLVRCLRVGLMTEEVLCGPDTGVALQRLLERADADLAMTEDEVRGFIVASEELVAETGRVLQLKHPDMDSYADLLVEATTRMQALTLEAHDSIVEGNREVQELSRRNEQLRHKATTDSLTGLPNRGQFDLELERLTGADAARRSDDEGVALLLLDLDSFKSVNDTYGHAFGDEVLRTVGAAIKETTRLSDLPARYGGEEFVVLFPRVSQQQLASIAERFRASIADLVIPLPSGEGLRVSVSIGGAMLGESADVVTGRELVERADHRLYEAKRAGRNRSVLP